MFPTAISGHPLVRNMQQSRCSKWTRSVFKLSLLPFSKLLDVFSPLILKQIMNVLADPDEETTGTVLGMEFGYQDLFFWYAGTWLGNQVLTVCVQYLIESDGVLSSRMRLVEYIEVHNGLDLIQVDQPVGTYLDEIKGLDKAIRDGSRSFFDLYSYLCEFIIILVLYHEFYGEHFAKTLITVPFIYTATAVVDIFLNFKFSLPFKQSAKKFMSVAEEILSNYKTIHLYNAREAEARIYDNAMRDVEEKYRIKGRILSIFSILQKSILGLGLYSMADNLGKSIVDPSSPYKVGDFVVVTALYLKFVMPLTKLGDTLRELVAHNAYMDAFVKKFNARPTHEVKRLLVQDYSTIFENTHNIKFKHVNFSYPENDERSPLHSLYS